MSDRELSGHVALVTGAARGIGAAIAQRLAAAGAQVCAADVIDAGPVADRLCDAGHVALATALDVTDPHSWDVAAKLTATELGAPTILVNNAGVMDSAYVHKMTDRQWSAVNDVVLRGTFNGVRAVAPWFRGRERRDRRIVNISSLAGIYGGIAGANYIAAKAGVIGLTRAMAAEWASLGVTVNAVAPGLVSSQMSEENLPLELRGAMLRRIPLGRIGTPEDIAAAVGFLCSPGASYITSQVIEVSGGLTDLSPPDPGD